MCVCVTLCLCVRERRGERQFSTLVRLDYFIVWRYYNLLVKLMRGYTSVVLLVKQPVYNSSPRKLSCLLSVCMHALVSLKQCVTVFASLGGCAVRLLKRIHCLSVCVFNQSNDVLGGTLRSNLVRVVVAPVLHIYASKKYRLSFFSFFCDQIFIVHFSFYIESNPLYSALHV